jgi:hypothetical protein
LKLAVRSHCRRHHGECCLLFLQWRFVFLCLVVDDKVSKRERERVWCLVFLGVERMNQEPLG